MYTWIRDNNKKIMAVFAAVLMVAFFLPTTFRPPNIDNPIVGRYDGGGVVRLQDFFRANQHWKVLTSPPPDGLFVRVGTTLGDTLAAGPLGPDRRTGNVAVRTIGRDPDAFALLVREAERMGLHVPDAEVDRVLTERVINTPTDPASLANVRDAVRNFLLVDAAYRRAGSAVKVSRPLAAREMAEQTGEVKLGLVEFDAATFTAAVPAPTPEQVTAHFERYADTLPGRRTDENPFGFGYKVPDRAKLQYLSLDPARVRERVMAQREPYEWEVLARKYHLEHGSEFPTTAALEATTQPTTAPTTRPFAEVQQDATDRVVRPEVDRLVSRIATRLADRFTADFAEFQKTGGGGATTVPAGDGYGSHAYLERVAQDVQREFGVLPAVHSLEQNLLTENELSVLPEIGSAWGEQTVATALAALAPLRDAPPAPGTSSLQLLEFARPVTTGDGKRLFFRFTAADRAHRPASVDAVREQVTQDLKLQAGYEKAKAEARALLAQAKATTLRSAAAVTGRSVTVAGPVRNQPQNAPFQFQLPIPGFDPGDAHAQFQSAAFDLLASPTRDSTGTPVDLIELPRAGKVVVAAVDERVRTIPPEQQAIFDAGIPLVVARDLGGPVQAEWFAYDNVAARLGYRPIAGGDTDGAAAATTDAR